MGDMRIVNITAAYYKGEYCMKTWKHFTFIIFILVFCCNNLFAQNTVQEPSQSPSAKYRLFRTTNIWTFIKLDTSTGKMWQVQYSLDGFGIVVVLNEKDLASEKDRVSGRFTLYPTSNMWTFILIDQIDGDTWQVQWSQNKKNRIVLPID
jgi:putative copper export protein